MFFIWCSAALKRLFRQSSATVLFSKCAREKSYSIMNQVAHSEIVKIIAKLEKKVHLESPGYIMYSIIYVCFQCFMFNCRTFY